MKKFLILILLLPLFAMGQVSAPTSVTTKLSPNTPMSFGSLYSTPNFQYGWLNGSIWEQFVSGRQINKFFYPKTHIDSIVAGYIPLTNSALFSRRIIYAKQFGAHLNSNINSGGGTNDAVILQAAIDTLTNRGGGTLVIDGVALINATVVLKSNVKIQVINGGGIFLAPNSNCHMLTTVLTGQTVSNYNVAIEGGVWNGNCDNQNRWVGRDSTSATTQWVCGMWLGSMNGYTLNNVTMRNSKTFAIILCQSYNGVANNTTFLWDNAATFGNNHDSFHLFGTLDHLVINGVVSTGGDDDVIGINTDECMPGTTAGIFEGPQRGTTSAGITNLTVRDVKAHLNGRILRVIGYGTAGALIDNIDIYNFSGDVGFGMNWTALTNSGRILIDGWNVTDSGGQSSVNIAGGAQSLSLSNLAGGTPVVLGTPIVHKSGDYFSQPKIIAYKPSATSTTYATTDSVSQILANLNSRALVAYPTAGIALSTGSAWGTSITDNSANWNTAFSQTRQWDGGATGLVAATGRTSLGGSTVGQNLFTLTNPSAVTFPRINADNSVSTLDAATFRAAIGAGTGSGTVTSVSGTTNRITSTGGATPVIDISSTFEALLGKVASPLSQFASTTSAQLRGILSDESGTGVAVFQNGDLGTTPIAGGLTMNGALNMSAPNSASKVPVYWQYSNNAGSRTWSVINDQTVNGDFGIYQSTTQTGSTFAPALYFDAARNANILGSLTLGAANSATKQPLIFPYSNNASSRSWSWVNDQTVFGDIGLYQSSTQTGAPNTAALYFDASRNATFAANLSAVLPAYSSGGYSFAAVNTTSNRLERVSSFTTLVQGDLLFYNGSNWVNSHGIPFSSANDITGQTTAATITAFTVGGSDASFMVTANLNITAIAVDVIQTQVTYTDETNTGRTLVMYGMGLTSAGLTTTGVSNYSPVAEIRAKAGTTITVATNLTTSAGSITYNAHATIIPLR